jgi:protein-S-isoprenylcysteine O-methyltransferase Ste14
MMLLGIGYSLLFLSGTLAVSWLAFWAPVLRRIPLEERVMSQRFSGYRAYIKRTHRLVPFVY